VPQDTNRVWIDTTFVPKANALEGETDVSVEYQLAAADNIGGRSIPVIYTAGQPSTDADIDIIVEYTGSPAISGSINVAEEYYITQAPMISGVLESLVGYTTYAPQSVITENIQHIYSTGHNTVSGSLDKIWAYTKPNAMAMFSDVFSTFFVETSNSGIVDHLVNYTNFSGDTNISGEPIPTYPDFFDVIHEYTPADPDYTQGLIDRTWDITFTGWVGTYVGFDTRSTLHGFNDGYDYEVMISGGGVDVNYLDAYSTGLTVSGVDLDVYCTLTDMTYLPTETQTISGSIGRQYYEVYSAASSHGYLSMDIDLYSLKITNFSLDIGEHTTSSSPVYVDVLDDVCPVSTSGTYFLVDGVKVPVTLSGIADGYRMYYDPADDFVSLEGTTTFTAHAENECGQSLEQDYYLTFGYLLEYDNHPSLSQGIDYGFNNEVVVRVAAEDNASCPQIGSLAWDFESSGLHNNDLGASIVGRFHALDTDDISANIRPQSLAYFYGKEFEIVVNAKDFAGNEMEPLVLNFTIEDEPG
jgi:hypothetical protein